MWKKVDKLFIKSFSLFNFKTAKFYEKKSKENSESLKFGRVKSRFCLTFISEKNERGER